MVKLPEDQVMTARCQVFGLYPQACALVVVPVVFSRPAWKHRLPLSRTERFSPDFCPESCATRLNTGAAQVGPSPLNHRAIVPAFLLIQKFSHASDCVPLVEAAVSPSPRGPAVPPCTCPVPKFPPLP